MSPWTIGHDEPFDEYECEECEDECTCLEDGGENWSEEHEATRAADAAERWHAPFSNGWSPQ